MEQKIRIGIDIGGTTVKLGLVDADQQIIRKTEIPTNIEKPWREVMQGIGLAGQMLLKDTETDRCAGVGVAMPGTVDSDSGMVLYSNNFGWENVPLREALSEYLPFPTAIANDADCAVLGEASAGAARGYEDVLMVTLGTGFGAGVLLNGKIFSGKLRGGTELGHTVLIMDGEKCSCGRRGCIESYASATALIRQGQEAMAAHPESLLWEKAEQDSRKLGTKMIFDAAREGDAAAETVLEQYRRYLTVSLANFVNIFRPQIIVVGGGLSRQGDYLLGSVNAALQKECFGGTHAEIPPVMAAQLRNDAGMIGAANLISLSGQTD